MNAAEARKQIDEFETHYRYDGTYMRDLLDHSPVGFAKFNDFLPLSNHHEKLSTDEYWVAKLAAMQIQDCGDCLQLNVRMALEAGVAKPIIEAAIKGGSTLPDTLRDIYHYAKYVASNSVADIEVMDRIASRYDKGAILELGLCVATGAVFPTIKRALGYTRSCRLVEITI